MTGRITYLAMSLAAAAMLSLASCSSAPDWGRGSQDEPVEGLANGSAVPEPLPPMPATAPAQPNLLRKLAEREQSAALAPIEPGKELFSKPYEAAVTPQATYIQLQQGAAIDDRAGWLDNPAGEWVFFFADAPNENLPLEPMQLLPNTFLAVMEDEAVKASPRRVMFRVSGEVMEYRGRRFLYVHGAAVEDVIEPKASSQPDRAERIEATP